MTYASWLGSPGVDKVRHGRPSTAPSPQSYMMFDIAALQALYGANYGKAGTKAVYTWKATNGQQFNRRGCRCAPLQYRCHARPRRSSRRCGRKAPLATFDLSNFTKDQVDDLRPGHWLRFDDDKLADLNNQVDAGTEGVHRHRATSTTRCSTRATCARPSPT